MEEVTEMGGRIPVKESWMQSSRLCNLRYFPPPLSAGGLGNAFPHLPQWPRGIMRESHLVFFDAVALQSAFLGPGHRFFRKEAGQSLLAGWGGGTVTLTPPPPRRASPQTLNWIHQGTKVLSLQNHTTFTGCFQGS